MSALTLMPPDTGLDVHVEQQADLAGGIAAAVFDSPRRTYRYLLTRIWGPAVPPAVFIMLNPSTASADKDDPTIRRIAGPKGFARREGAGGVIVVNLFALCSTNPERLRRHHDPVGPYNALFVRQAVREASLVVAAWGGGGVLANRGFDMARSLHAMGVRLKALNVTSTGQPGHPLYVPNDAPLIDYQPEAHA
ncbi:DUF1643 domain-containing protein [Streptomyces sp. NPDC018584]|uniref:DUF1643 domain-containing protein n=1 Tax=unclassified Streptomyces TaxID=2593676 RepID=UPI0037B4952D